MVSSRPGAQMLCRFLFTVLREDWDILTLHLSRPLHPSSYCLPYPTTLLPHPHSPVPTRYAPSFCFPSPPSEQQQQQAKRQCQEEH